jgi:hypothetical protein
MDHFVNLQIINFMLMPSNSSSFLNDLGGTYVDGVPYRGLHTEVRQSYSRTLVEDLEKDFWFPRHIFSRNFDFQNIGRSYCERMIVGMIVGRLEKSDCWGVGRSFYLFE